MTKRALFVEKVASSSVTPSCAPRVYKQWIFVFEQKVAKCVDWWRILSLLIEVPSPNRSDPLVSMYGRSDQSLVSSKMDTVRPCSTQGRTSHDVSDKRPKAQNNKFIDKDWLTWDFFWASFKPVASMGDRVSFVITDVDALITHIAFVVQMESDQYIGAFVDTRGYLRRIVPKMRWARRKKMTKKKEWDPSKSLFQARYEATTWERLGERSECKESGILPKIPGT